MSDYCIDRVEDSTPKLITINLDEHVYTVVFHEEIEYESSYGADADGNRGVGCDFVVGVDIIDAICEDDITVKIDDKTSDRIKEIIWGKI